MKPNLTIGIIAFNEESSIGILVDCILKQNTKNYNLEKIVVISDGSSDRTVEFVKRIKSDKIRIIDSKDRLGKPSRINWLFNNINSDLLLTLDADTYISSRYFIDEMVKGYTKKNSLFVSSNPTPINGKTLLERSINNYFMSRNYFRNKFDYSKTQYGYQGLALLYHKSFYKKLHIPSNILNDDTFCFLTAKKMRIKTCQQKNAHIYFRSPNNLNDYINQMARYIKGAKQLRLYFDEKLINNYQIKSKKFRIYSILYQILKNPIGFIYLKAVFIYIKFYYIKHKKIRINWAIISSTKSNLTL